MRLLFLSAVMLHDSCNIKSCLLRESSKYSRRMRNGENIFSPCFKCTPPQVLLFTAMEFASSAHYLFFQGTTFPVPPLLQIPRPHSMSEDCGHAIDILKLDKLIANMPGLPVLLWISSSYQSTTTNLIFPAMPYRQIPFDKTVYCTRDLDCCIC